MLYTLLQIIAFQTLFLLVYDLFLKRETFFNYNRAYLFITIVWSIILPFIKWPQLKAMAVKDIVIQLPEVFLGAKIPSEHQIRLADQAGVIIEQPQMPIWENVIFIGIGLAMLIFMSKVMKLFWLRHKNPKTGNGNNHCQNA